MAALDPRQILAGVLTITMFVMLADMIKRDYYDSHPPHGIRDTNKVSENGLESVTDGDDGSVLKPCWNNPVLNEADESRGYVTFSLTHGPEFHVSQIADAVVVARHLGATLVIPDIRGSSPTDTSNFEDVYNVEKFIESLEGAVRVVKSLPSSVSSRNIGVVKVPNRVTEEYIAENVEPVFRAKGSIRIVTYFQTVNMKVNEHKSKLDSIACLGMFGTLEPKTEIRQVIDSMVDRLNAASRKSNGKFVAVDLRIDILDRKGCQVQSSGSTKSCYTPQEVALFLKNIGFDRDTTVYVTETNWHNTFYALKDAFPKTYTKESIIPMDKKDEFLNSDKVGIAKVIDYYVCSESDVFVPAISGLFYANVAGNRIASGRTQILVPANIPYSSSAQAEEFLSPYVSKKNHFAYSCFC